MRRLLVSACLLGVPCRYDGQSKPHPGMEALLGRCQCVPVCPEQLGGLPTPRPPAERRGEGVFTAGGEEVTAQYLRGAEIVCRLAQTMGCQGAVLKEKSPSCGLGAIYDGTFSKTLAPGNGVTAQALMERGVPVYTEAQIAWLAAEGLSDFEEPP